MDKSELAFDSVLSSRTTDKRIALIVFPVVIVLAAVIGFAAVAISRMSGLQDQARIAQRQVQEAQQALDERDRQLREARADASILGSAGQGAAVLAPARAGSGANGVALYHPESKALSLFVYNLAPPPEGQEYRLVVTDAEGQERLLAPVKPDDRGAAHALARDLPEGLAKVEVALVPASSGGGAAAQGTGAGGAARAPQGQAAQPERETVVVGQLPKPGEAGVVLPKAPEGAKARARGRR
jgi:hypothetical protein